MVIKVLSKILLVALASGFFVGSAVAQWQWLDKDGRKVFSDRAPPAEIPEKSIFKRPAGSPKIASSPQPLVGGDAAAGGAKATIAAAVPASGASAPKLTGKDSELEARKKKAEDEATARKKAEEDKIAKTNADNCERAKASMATLQSGIRLSSINANGEREIYDDAKRAAETRRTQDLMDATCK